MRKLLLFLSIFVTLSVFSETVVVDGVEYSIIKKAQLASVHKSGVSYMGGDVVIPSTIVYNDTTYDVVAIDEYAFDVNGMSDVPYGNISLPNTIKTIGMSAFSHCKIDTLRIPNLSFYCQISFSQNYWVSGASPLSYTQHLLVDGEEVNDLIIPNDVDSISAYAFWNAKPIKSVVIPPSVKSIGEYAFAFCRGIENVEIQGETFLAEAAFEDCTKIKKISFLNEAKLGLGAFAGCNMIESVDGDINITEMEMSAFRNCSNLKNFTFSDKIKAIDRYVFQGCSNLSAIKLPNSCSNILEGAFDGCAKLVTIELGGGLTRIDSYSFGNCPELTDVYIYTKGVPKTHSDAFAGSLIEYVTLHVRESVVDLFKESTPWNTFKEIVKIDIPKYTITYYVDGEIYNAYEIEEGESVTPDPAPTKEGYTFSGWSEIPDIMPANDVTITGTFSINKYKLTYMVDNEVYKTDSIEYGATITPEEAPTKEGYTFSGWSDIPETMPANNVTITGTFSVNKYKLTYMVDGAEYKSYDVEYGAAITPEPAPAKEGYSFSGWSDIPETMPANDVTVTGTFSVNKYKLTYMVDGAEYKSYDVDYGAAITPEPEPTKEGYTFSGWSDIPEKMPANDLTVTGTFSINKYKLTYLVDGAEYKSYDIEYGATITPEPAPTKDGYTFSGWSDIPETMPANDVTITGTFSAIIVTKYTLTYKVDGEVYKTYELEEGTAITPEPTPTKEGYTFSGWSDIPETMPANDVTITGTFSINKYKLTYMVDGVEYMSYDIEYGATISPEPAPTKDGYTFSGWSDIPETMPAKDVVVSGSFSAIEIKEDTGDFTATSGSTAELSNDNNVSGEYEIPETVTHDGVTYTVTSIGNEAFKDNTNLTDVTIPSTITSIGESAFAGCSNLKSITVNSTTPIAFPSASRTRGGSSIFEGVDKNTCILYVPEGSVELYKASPVWSDFQNILAIGSTGINGIIHNGEPQDVYDLKGRKVKAKVTSLEGLPRGIYIINGKKIIK